MFFYSETRKVISIHPFISRPEFLVAEIKFIDAQKNRLIATVLLSTDNICFFIAKQER